jgi:pentose-5-phosphate-3-epimerase
MAAAGAQQYTFHAEATDNVMECINKVKSANMKVIFELAVIFFTLALCIFNGKQVTFY